MTALMNTLQRLAWSNWGFAVFIGFVLVLVNAWSMFVGPPSGIHFTRQTDSLSFVANFAAGAPFTEPEVYNLNSIEGRSGAEFPLLYWVSAQAWKLFGEQEWLLRLFTALLCMSGLFALLRITQRFVTDAFMAWAIAALTIASPILFYYLPNFLPDASALGCALLGWAAFFRYWMDERPRSAYVAVFWFTLSGLLKITYFIHPIAALSSLVLIGWMDGVRTGHLLKRHAVLIIGLALGAAATAGWNLYAIAYNTAYKNYYFLVESRPIWKMDRAAIAQVWEYMTEFWFKHYYFGHFTRLFWVLLLVSLVFMKHGARRLQAVAWFSALGGLAYAALFFKQFRDHDYYFMVFIPIVGLNLINAFVTLKNRFGSVVYGPIAKVFMYLFLTVGLWQLDLVDRYRKVEMERRFDDTSALYSSVREALDQAGISRDARMLVVADPTENGSLYFLRRKGWTVGDASAFTDELAEIYRVSGAEYLVCSPGIHPPSSIQKQLLSLNGVNVYVLN